MFGYKIDHFSQTFNVVYDLKESASQITSIPPFNSKTTLSFTNGVGLRFDLIKLLAGFSEDEKDVINKTKEWLLDEKHEIKEELSDESTNEDPMKLQDKNIRMKARLSVPLDKERSIIL